MEEKFELGKTWEDRFAAIGIAPEILQEANIPIEFYKSLYDSSTGINRASTQKITSSRQLQLLTGKREYYELYCVHDDVPLFNPAFYALCSGSREAWDYLEEFHPRWLIALKNSDLRDIAAASFGVIKKCNILMLNKVIDLFQYPDLCLMFCIYHGWLEGVLEIAESYPKAFTIQDNYHKLTDCGHYPHHAAFIKFNLPILNWFKENKESLFFNPCFNYDQNNIIAEDALRQKTTEKLDWLLSNFPVFLVRDVFLKSLAHCPEPKIILDWFKKNRAWFFPLTKSECYALANRVLSFPEKIGIFNEILLLTEETAVTHFSLEFPKSTLENFNTVMNNNFDLETIGVHHDRNKVVLYKFFWNNGYDVTKDPLYIEICDKLWRNRALKTWPTLSLMFVGIIDEGSYLYQYGMCLDILVTFCKQMIFLFKAFELEEPIEYSFDESPCGKFDLC